MWFRPFHQHLKCFQYHPLVPGRYLPAGEGGRRGSLCPRLCTLSTSAGSRTSSPWRRMSRGQNSCKPVAQRKTTALEKLISAETHFGSFIKSKAQRKTKHPLWIQQNEKYLLDLMCNVENLLSPFLVDFFHLYICSHLVVDFSEWMFWRLSRHVIKQLLTPLVHSAWLCWVTDISAFMHLPTSTEHP